MWHHLYSIDIPCICVFIVSYTARIREACFFLLAWFDTMRSNSFWSPILLPNIFWTSPKFFWLDQGGQRATDIHFLTSLGKSSIWNTELHFFQINRHKSNSKPHDLRFISWHFYSLKIEKVSRWGKSTIQPNSSCPITPS